MGFTAEELAEMAVADQEIEESFCLTQDEIVQSRLRDKRIIFENMPFDCRKVAAAQKAYREANREKLAAEQADILKRLRLDHGYTQRELAKLLGVSQGCISLWESRSMAVNWDLVAEKLPYILAFAEGG